MTELLGIILSATFIAGMVAGWAANSLTLSEGPWPPLDRGEPE